MSPSRVFYGSAVFLSAFLLFLIEPVAAKELLPVLGGSSAVWLTCLVFFQATLLLGYLYARWLARNRRQHLHVGLLAAAVLLLTATTAFHTGLSATAGSQAAAHPVTIIFATLALTIGLPFLLLASTSPLLQIWLHRSEAAQGRDGKVWYRLFALSNAGSLLALLAYPTLVEPHLTLRHQRVLWALGFAVYAILSGILAARTGSSRETAQTSVTPEPRESLTTPLATKWLWFLLPMGAAMQLSAVTAHITINIAAIPLLWILPLAAYLITFIIAFESPRLYRRGLVVRLLVVMLASLGYLISKTDVSIPIGIAILFFLVEAFLACLFCHAEAYALRPQRASETTLFYLMVAAGGVTGTFFIGVASPLLFSANYDLAITFFVTATLGLAITWRDGWGQRLLWGTGSVLLLFLTYTLHGAFARQALLEVRNFYGSLRVKQVTTPEGVTMRMLLNGTIQHGTQLFSADLNKTPTTYYAEDSGVGLALEHCCEGRPRNIGVVGLGVGTLAAYGKAGDRIRFYEINPLVQPIAQNLFTYLRDSHARISFAEGDARASLTREAPQSFDVLVVDAFSGDAIPLHLLTTEALALYQRHLAPGGIIAFHVSNQYLNLAPEIAELAASAKVQAKLVDTPSVDSRGEYRATWVLLSNSPTFFALTKIAAAATPVSMISGVQPWTDDYSSLLPILRLGRH